MIDQRVADKPDSQMKPMQGKGEEIAKRISSLKDEPWAKDLIEEFKKVYGSSESK